MSSVKVVTKRHPNLLHLLVELIKSCHFNFYYAMSIFFFFFEKKDIHIFKKDQLNQPEQKIKCGVK